MTLTPRHLPARSIPVPTTVSPALQLAISQPLEEAIKAAHRFPKSIEEWTQIIAAYDAASEERFAQLCERFPVSIQQDTIAGVNTYRLIPHSISPENQHRLLIHLHGGGYALSSGKLGIGEGILTAYHGQIPVISVDYRELLDHPFPAALEDAIAVWEALIQTHNPNNLGIFGTSAGGGLTLATLLKLRELKLPFPAAIAPLSPWADLSKTGDSLFVNEYIDEIAISYDGVLEGMAKLYAGKEELKNPLISPIYGDFQGFPPTLLISGTRDLLLSDTVRVHRKLRQAGVKAELQMFEALSHAEYLYQFEIPESLEVFQELRSFFDQHLG